MPKRPHDQLQRAKKKLMGDETYLKINFKTLSDHKFYIKGKYDVPVTETTFLEEKFGQQILVLQAKKI